LYGTEIYKMFQEYTEIPVQKSGWIEVVTGSMFSGKTEELIRRIKRAQIAKLKVQVFKPEIDNRYSKNEIVSHSNYSVKCQAVNKSSQLYDLALGYQVIGIDEAQFFDADIIEVCNSLANNGTRVIVAGLDMDFSGKPFGPMPQLMAIAEFVTKVHAICVETGELANFSHRLDSDDDTIFVGGQAAYEPVSRSVFKEIQKKKSNEPSSEKH